MLKLYKILFWVFFVLSIIFFFWYLFGKSPSLEQSLFILIIGLLFKIHSNVTISSINVNGLNKRFNNLEASFIRLVKDFKGYIKHK